MADDKKIVMNFKVPTKLVVLKPKAQSKLALPGTVDPGGGVEPQIMDVVSINDVRAIRSMVARGMICEVPSFPITDQLMFYTLEQLGLAVKEEVPTGLPAAAE